MPLEKCEAKRMQAGNIFISYIWVFDRHLRDLPHDTVYPYPIRILDIKVKTTKRTSQRRGIDDLLFIVQGIENKRLLIIQLT